jgi:hypothetical protein
MNPSKSSPNKSQQSLHKTLTHLSQPTHKPLQRKDNPLKTSNKTLRMMHNQRWVDSVRSQNNLKKNNLQNSSLIN